MSDYSPFDGERREKQPLVLIETCWRLLGSSGKPIVCGIYRTAARTIEVRCGYSDADLVRSQYASHIDIAQDIAAAWKQAAIDKGFKEI